MRTVEPRRGRRPARCWMHLVGAGAAIVVGAGCTVPPAALEPVHTAADLETTTRAASPQAPPRSTVMTAAMKPAYPSSRVEAVTDTLFGVAVPDPYRWLEDEKSDEVRAWMQAQDRFAREALGALPGREALMARLRQLFYVDSVSPPVRRGSRWFYRRTHADREKGVYYWRQGEDGEERVLLDPNRLSSDGSVAVGVLVPSWNGELVAYTLKQNNSDEATLHVMEVATGRVSSIDTIAGAKYATPSWTPTNDAFYYTWLPTDPAIPVAERPGQAEVRLHRVGTDPKTDVLVRERTGDPQTFLSATISRDGHWLLCYVQHGWTSTDVYYRDLRPQAAAGQKEKGKGKAATGKTASPTASAPQPDAWRPLVVGRKAQYEVHAWRDRLYVVTNEGAPRWRVMVAEAPAVERASWRELVAEAPDATLDGAAVLGEHLVVSYLRDAKTALEVRTLAGAKVRELPLPEPGSAGVVGNPDDDVAYVSFTSFTRAAEIHRVSIAGGASRLWAEVKLPIDPSPYAVEQVWFRSKDGTRVPMFVVRRKDMPRDGSTPFILEGYGGFNVNMTPAFKGSLYPWLEAGGGFALPNLRGGGELGEAWHEAGMGTRKQNVFDDFLAAADFLVAEGYTRPERLAIRGGSNGGLLVGAALVQRPAALRAVVCAVPLLDMVRYHRFGSGKTWVPEYGSADDEPGFRSLHAYSPYHHVQAGTSYPAVLLLSADSDDRVDPMHARKMAAALQAATTGEHPVLLRIEENAGHGGGDMVKKAVEQSADALAFVMRELGVRPPQDPAAPATPAPTTTTTTTTTQAAGGSAKGTGETR